MDDVEALCAAAEELRDRVDQLTFAPPVACVYNPLRYAGRIHEAYLRQYGRGPKRVVFLGMNPGPFGMAQTGVPFGEVAMVRDWLGLSGTVDRPACEHPSRPVLGFECPRSEVSGRRLWGLFAERFPSANAFFEGHFVANYCPLVFMSSSGANITPDKLRPAEVLALHAACDAHLRSLLAILEPEFVVGVGGFAADRATKAVEGMRTRVIRILHPSPANPAANRDWSGQVTRTLSKAGIWP